MDLKQDDMVQDICLSYWFFLIKNKDNYIKALFRSKQTIYLLRQKKLFLRMVEHALTSIIENKIKEKDKANLYSYK
jgi:hypothetical protein